MKKTFSFKPDIRIVAGAVGILVLILALTSLRHKTAPPPEDDAVEQADEDDSSPQHSASGRTRSRVSVFTESRPVGTPHPAKVNRIAAGEKIEDFDAQKLRAFGEASIYGVIRGEENKPLPGAKVQLYENDPMTKDPPLREGVTDEQGSYTLTQLNDGEVQYIQVVRAEGFVPEARTINLNGGPLQRDYNLERGVPLAGAVRDAQTSQPLSNTTVFFPTSGETVFAMLGTVNSGPLGEFSFPSVKEGPLRSLALHDGYHKTSALLRSPNKQAEIAMEPGGATMRGVTISRFTQKPESGARVIAAQKQFQDTVMSQGEGGTFEFNDMPAGRYKLSAIKGMSSEPMDITLADREVRENIQIVLPSDLLVQGRVEHAGDGHPLPGIRIWYRGPSGKKSAVSDEQGQFAFETMAVGEYTMEVHEKRYLPVVAKGTTGSVETITRKIPQGAASDQVIIKMKPVPSIEGNVKGSDKNGKPTGPVFGIDVEVSYLQDKVFERKVTQTDPQGNFFVNLPTKARGVAKVVATRRGQTDSKALRIPDRKPVNLVLRPTVFRGQLLLVDRSVLSGVKLDANYFLQDDQPPEKALRVPAASSYTGTRGTFAFPLGEHQKVELVFYLPDGKTIPKIYNIDSLLKKGAIFIYDPVAGDILTDMKDRPPNQPKPTATPKPTPAPRPK